jgi:TrmH family RNA methyltransferase
MITSSANLRIKQIRKLRDHKERLQTGMFYAEGLRIVIEAFAQEAAVQTLLYSPELLTSEVGKKLIEDQRGGGVETLEVSADVFKTLALKEDPQGIAAVVGQSWTGLGQIRLKKDRVWVALDSIADPGNLGTILRTNDAVGGEGVILLENSTDPYDPTCIRASMGAIFSQTLVRTRFEDFAAWKRASNWALIGTSGAADLDYHHISYPRELVLFMGSERKGLPEEALALCDQIVRIPMAGQSDSLNLAVATGIMLYEIYNLQRDQKKGGSS